MSTRHEPHVYQAITYEGKSGWSLAITDEKLRFKSANGWSVKSIPWSQVVRRQVRGKEIKLILKKMVDDKNEEVVFQLEDQEEVESQLFHLRQDLTEHLLAVRRDSARNADKMHPHSHRQSAGGPPMDIM